MALLVGALAVFLVWFVRLGPDLDEVVDAARLHLAPQSFRNHVVRRLVGPHGEQLLLVGTAHDLHWTSEAWPIGDLVEVLDHERPELVLVEIRPQDLAGGLDFLGPSDMAYLAQQARVRGIEVAGFDWWSEAVAREAINRGDRDFVNGAERNRRMAERILAAAAGHRRTVAFTGYSHVRRLVDELERAGWTESPLTAEERDAIWRSGARAGALAEATGDAAETAWTADTPMAIDRAIRHVEALIAAEGREDGWTRELRRKRDKLRDLRARATRAGGRRTPTDR